jgi:hypothetical protein
MSRVAASQFRSSRPIARPLLQAACLAEFVETCRTLKRGLFDPYRPELHYMRGPGPKWREKHVAQNVEERASHFTFARAVSVVVRGSVLVAFILFSGIALALIPASASLAGKFLTQAGFSTISCLTHNGCPDRYSEARSARSGYSRGWRPSDSHPRTSAPPTSPRPRCQEDLGYGRTSSWGCG